MGEIKLKFEKRQFAKLCKNKRSLSELPIIDFIFVRDKFKDNVLMENGLQQNFIFTKERLLTKIYIILIVLNTFMLYVYVSLHLYQYQSDKIQNKYSTMWMYLTYAIHLILNIVLSMLLKAKYQRKSVLQKQNYTFVIPIIKVIISLVIHPMPWINDLTVNLDYDDGDYNNLTFPLKVNYLIIILAVIKNIFLVYVKIMVYTCFFGPRSERIKKLFSVGCIQQLFALKCMFKQYPIKLVLSLCITGFIFFSIVFSIVESHVPIQANPFRHIQNCIWFTFITIATVGYGDVKIHTHVGYFMDMFCMVWGTFINSCILVVLINTLSLGSLEVESLAALKRLEGDRQYNRIRKEYIRMSLWRLWKNYKHQQGKQQPWIERKLRKKLHTIRKLNRNINPTTNLAFLAKLQFDNAIINIQYLFNNNAQIIKFIGNHIFSQALSHQNIYTEKTIPDRSFIEEPIRSTQGMKNQNDYIVQIDKIGQEKLMNMHVLKIEDLSVQDIHSNKEEQQQ